MSSAPVVVDVGSGMIKAGFAGEDAPRTVFPSVVGRHKQRAALSGILGGKDSYVGNQAQSRRGLLNLRYPLQQGQVTNWDDLELLWRHTFYNELKVFAEDHAAILTEPPFNPKENREKTVEIMFESFGFDKVDLVLGGLMSLYASGRSTGIVLDAGDSQASAIPVAEGFVNLHAIMSLSIGGRDLSQRLGVSLQERGRTLEGTGEKEIAKDIKEKLCYVVKDFEAMDLLKEDMIPKKQYTLPDGTEVTLSEELYRVPEILFQPAMMGSEQTGVVDLIDESISKVAIDLRRPLYDNVVMVGGSTMFKGFKERLEIELKRQQNLYRTLETRREGKKWTESKKELVVESREEKEARAAKVPIRVIPTENPIFASWIGASIYGCTYSFNSQSMSREDFDEYGAEHINDPNRLHLK